MKYIKWLLRNRPEFIMVVLAVIAFVVGVIVSHNANNSLDKQHKAAVDVVCETETIEPNNAAPPPQTKPLHNYFDVPLSCGVQEHIFTECEKYNIHPSVVVAMIHRESNFNQYCLGDDGRSAGLMQIQAKWHLKRMINLGCTDLFDPYQNITVGIHYLAELTDKYDGNIEKALVAYNQGSYKGTVTAYAKAVMEKAGELDESNG